MVFKTIELELSWGNKSVLQVEPRDRKTFEVRKNGSTRRTQETLIREKKNTSQ